MSIFMSFTMLAKPANVFRFDVTAVTIKSILLCSESVSDTRVLLLLGASNGLSCTQTMGCLKL
jgi:hypothetical protein